MTSKRSLKNSSIERIVWMREAQEWPEEWEKSGNKEDIKLGK